MGAPKALNAIFDKNKAYHFEYLLVGPEKGKMPVRKFYERNGISYLEDGHLREVFPMVRKTTGT
jgi:hypothetical protein